jgi:hypothetical protein
MWDDSREKYVHTRSFRSIDELREKRCDTLTTRAHDADRLPSLTCFPHFRITV